MGIKKIALLTSANLPQLIADEKPFIEALSAQGFDALPVIWNQAQDWKQFSAVVVRTPWDYFEHYQEFFKVLEKINQETILINDLSLMQWNSNKKYLLELSAQNIPIVPTKHIKSQADFHRELAQSKGSSFVLKPFVSAGSYKTYLWHRGESLEFLQGIDFEKEEFMLQPFLTDITTMGEVSLIFIGGVYSHAIKKLPAIGDFRVQEDFGGSVSVFQPSDDELARAVSILKLMKSTPTYARIDFSWHQGEFCVMELELIEPELFFRFHPQASQRLAQEITKDL